MHKLKEYRFKLHTTQRELAYQCGVSQTTIHVIERGWKIPGNELKHAIAKALKVSVKDIFPDEARGRVRRNERNLSHGS